MATMWWYHKGSATSTSAPTHLLRNQALNQRFHRYFPRHEFVKGIENAISDLTSRSTHLTNSDLLQYFHTYPPQTLLWCMCTPPRNSVSCVVSVTQRGPWPRASLLQDPPTPIPTGRYGPPSAPKWNSTQYYCRTRTSSQSSPPLPPSNAVEK